MKNRKKLNRGAHTVLVSFRVSRAQFAAIVAATRELGVPLNTYCREVEEQWRTAWRAQQGAEPQPAPTPAPRDVLTVASDPPPYRPPRDPAPAPVQEPPDDAPDAEPYDDEDEEPGQSDPGEEPEDAQTYRPPRRATGPGPRHISDGRYEDEDDAEPPPTVHSVALSPYRKPNPAGIKQRQGKDYGTKSPGHDWAVIKPPGAR